MRVISRSPAATQIILALDAQDSLISPDQAASEPPDLVIGGPEIAGVPSLELSATTIDGVLDDILGIGLALDRRQEAQRLIVSLRERHDRAAEYVNAYEEGPSVAVLESTDPPSVPGFWVAQLVERAGGRYVLNPTEPKPAAGAAVGPLQSERVAGPSRLVTPEMLEQVDRLVLLADDPVATEPLTDQPWFAALSSVAIVDPAALLVPGPYLFDAFEFLVGWLQGRESLIPTGFPWTPCPPPSS